MEDNLEKDLDDLDFVEILEIISDYQSEISIHGLINNLQWHRIGTVSELLEELEKNYERG